jgi:hypothetical protein
LSADKLHNEKVLRLLPPNSALPPVLNLSQMGANVVRASRAWEKKFTGSMLSREITDPGTAPDVGFGSISTSTLEYAAHIWALPARSCTIIVIAKPIAGGAHLAYTRRLVYSTFTLEVLQVLKAERTKIVAVGDRISGAQFGGSLRFPSGHLETFVRTGEGFLEIGQSYILFLWKPIPSDEGYTIAEPYLIKDGTVFPAKTVADVSDYEKGVAFKDFEAKVKDAIARNIDSD